MEIKKKKHNLNEDKRQETRDIRLFSLVAKFLRFRVFKNLVVLLSVVSSLWSAVFLPKAEASYNPTWTSSTKNETITGSWNFSNGLVVSSGNVGIGTITPLSKLMVAGNVSIGTTGITPTANGLYVQGNVGIGWSDPGNYKVYVNGNVNASAYYLSGNDESLRRISSGISFYVSNKAAPIMTMYGGVNPAVSQGQAFINSLEAANTLPVFVVRGAAGQLTDLQRWQNSSNTVLANITAEGNIGVGTITPLSKLMVAGNVSIGTTQITAPTNGLYVEGNVGIGSTNPNYKLSVKGGGLIVESNQNKFVIDNNSFNAIFTTANDTKAFPFELPPGFSGYRTRVFEIRQSEASRDYGLILTPYSNFSGNPTGGFGITGTGDLDTYTFETWKHQWAANGASMRFRVDGTTFLYLDGATKNVGIGTITPLSKLMVAGNVSIGTTAVAGPLNGLYVEGNVGIGSNNPAVSLAIGSGGTADNVSGGDVYIQNDLEVDGSIYATNASVGGQAVCLADGTNCSLGGVTQLSELSDVGDSTASAGRLLIGDGDSFESAAMSGDATITSAGLVDISNVSGNFAVGTSDLFVNDATGNIGIGTTDASSKLTIAGNTLQATAGGVDNSLSLKAGNFTYLNLSTGWSSGLGEISSPAGNGIKFWAGNDSATNGSLVLRTASATVTLTGMFNGSGNGHHILIQGGSWSGNATAGNVLLRGGAGGGTYGQVKVQSADGLTDYVTVGNTGNVGIGTNLPLSKLMIAGNVAIGTTSVTAPTNGLYVEGNIGIGTTGTSGYLSLLKGSDTNPSISFADTQRGLKIYASDNNYGEFNLKNSYWSLSANAYGLYVPGGRIGNSSGNYGIIIASGYGAGGSSIYPHVGGASDLGISMASSWRDLWLSRDAYVAGNIGIGTITPLSKLMVNGGVSIGTTGIAAPANGLYVQGNVGLGSSSPSTALTIGSGGTIDNVGSGDVYIQNDLEVDGSIYAADASIGGKAICLADGTNCTSTVTDIGSLSDVGDGTTTNQNLLIADGDSWESVAMSGDATISNTGVVGIDNLTGNFSVGTSDLFVNDITGNVGIGTSMPLAKLNISQGDSSGLTDLLINPTIKNSGNLISAEVGGSSRFWLTSTGYFAFVDPTSSYLLASLPSGFTIKVPNDTFTINGASLTTLNGTYGIEEGNASTGYPVLMLQHLSTAITSNNYGYRIKLMARDSAANTAQNQGRIWSTWVDRTAAVRKARMILDVSDFAGDHEFMRAEGDGTGSLTSIGGLIADAAATLLVGQARDLKQFVVKGHSTQTNDLIEWQNSNGTILGAVTGSGNVGIGTNAALASLHVGDGGTPGVAGSGDVYVQNDLEVDGSIYAADASVGGKAICLADGTNCTSTVTDIGSLSDVGDGSTTTRNLLIADGDSWESVAMSGDATISNTGVVGIDNLTGNFSVGTNDLFVNDITGNVGIGTTAPGYALDVEGTLAAGSDKVILASSTAAFFSGTQTAKVTIGAAAIADNTYGIDIFPFANEAGSLRVTHESLLGGSGRGITFQAYPADGTGNVTLESYGATAHLALDSRYGDIIFGTTRIEKMRLLNNGNLGIGTVTPIGKLDIVGDEVRIWDGAATVDQATSSGDLYVERNLEVDGSIYAANLSVNGSPVTASGWTDGGTVVYPTDLTDKVGIGTSTPLNLLDVNGGAVIGRAYTGSATAPSDGLLVQGNIGIGTTDAQAKIGMAVGSYNGEIFRVNTTSQYGNKPFYITVNGSGVWGSSFLYVSEVQTGKVTVENGMEITPGLIRSFWNIPMVIRTEDATSMTFATNNNTRMTIDSGGNVGIGTITPLSKLMVAGGVAIGTTSVTAPTNGLYVAGNVGIGSSVPSALLDVNGKFIVSGVNGGTDVYISDSSMEDFEVHYSSSSVFTSTYDHITLNSWRGSNPFYITTGANVTTLTLKNGNNQPLILGTNNLERMRIAADGNVGIGTITPVGKLDIQGDEARIWTGAGTDNFATASGTLYVENTLEVDGSIYAANASIGGKAVCLADGTNCSSTVTTIGSLTDVGDGSTTAKNILIADGDSWESVAMSGDATISSAGVVDINNVTGNFSVGTSDLYVNETTGNVGIGTTNPTYLLEITGPVNTSPPNGIKFTNQGGAIVFASYGATISDTYGITLSTTALTRPVRVAGTSGLYLGSTSGVSTPAGSIIAEGGATFAGNVGIGTTVTVAKLSIAGSADQKQFVIQGNSTQTNNLQEWQNSSGVAGAWITGVSNSGPTIGIKHIGDNVTSTIYSSYYGLNIRGNKSYTNTFYAGEKIGSTIDDGASLRNVFDNGSGGASFAGNVGIGSSAPLAGLHIGTGGTPDISGTNDVYIQNDLEVDGSITGGSVAGGNIYVGTGTGTHSADVNLVKPLSGSAFLNIKGGAGRSKIVLGNDTLDIASGSTDIKFSTDAAITTSGTTRMVLARSGNLGIGTTAPAALLHVGTGGTLDVAGTGDAYIQNDLEVDGSVNFGNSTSVTIPAGSAPTVDAPGEIAIDTTGDDFVYYAGQKHSLSYKQFKSYTIEAPSDTDNVLWFKAPYPITITNIACIADPGDAAESVVIDVQRRDANGINPASVDSTITCNNSGGADDGSLSNGVISAGEWVSLDVGTVTGTVTQMAVTITFAKADE